MEVGVSHQLHRDRLTVLTEDFSLVMEEWGEVLVQVGGRDATRNLSPKKCGQTLPKDLMSKRLHWQPINWRFYRPCQKYQWDFFP